MSGSRSSIPLARSAVYRSATRTERRATHLALAEATNRDVDPDRRAWHLAAAATGPDEDVAVELELSARWARARGGLSASAALLQRAVAMTGDPTRRAARALTAAEASLGAGAFGVARGLLAAADVGPLDELGRARVDLLRAEVAFAQNRGGDAPQLLLKAAGQLEPLDPGLARDTYLEAWGAALFAGRIWPGSGSLLDVSRAASSAPPRPGPPLPRDLLLDGLALIFTAGRSAARTALRRGVAAFAGTEVSPTGDVAVGLAGDPGGELPLGLRQRSGDRCAGRAARPRFRVARGARRCGQRLRPSGGVRRGFRQRRRVGCGGGGRQGGHRDAHRTARRHRARRTARQGSRSRRVDRRHHR